jgi:Beta-lactamase
MQGRLLACGACIFALGLGLSTISVAAISLESLRAAPGAQPLVQNADFAPGPTSRPALEPFEGRIRLSETLMSTTPVTLKADPPLALKANLFPAAEVSFYTDGGDLVPVSQEIILAGSAGRGASYWDLIVQPGAVWSEAADQGWSRGGFPFALVNALEGETHNGVATFAYRRGKITDIRIQVVQQTAPFYVLTYFTATAQVPARLAAVKQRDSLRQRAERRASMSDSVRVAPWSDLEKRVGAAALENFDDGKSQDIVASGVDYDGTLYLKPCNTAAGPLPWCDRARFGVWSATKALVNEVALLRLAQTYGPGVFDEKIIDYVPQARDFVGWQTVTFADAINMATGLGNGKPLKRVDILEGTLDDYAPWYEARGKDDKVAAILEAAIPYPWKPGEVARYRDQDMFLVGVAMDAYVRKKTSRGLWDMLRTEVYEPIGIRTLPMNKTLERDGSAGQPLMAYGSFPTLTDLVRIARLYQNLGAVHGQQILYAPRIRELLRPESAPGLPTARIYPSGETYYINAFWETAYRSSACNIYFPQMEGWGGTEIALFPNQLNAIRIAKIWEDGGNAASDTTGMATVADRIKPFCQQLGSRNAKSIR